MVAISPLHKTFDQKVRNFPHESYRLEEHDHLTKLMRVLLEDSGVGQLHKIQTIARLSETLATTRFSELDYFFGTFLRFPRLPEEMYGADPFNDQLTADQWREIEHKDADYRERIKLFLQATMRGATNEGLAMAAHAACGYPCQIIEAWRYHDTMGMDTYIGRFPVDAQTPREFVVVPSTTLLTTSRRRMIYKIMERLKPANTVCTVDENGLNVRRVIQVRHVASPSEYFEVRKYVTGVNPPEAPPDKRYFWVKDGVEIEAPTFAHLRSMETDWSLNNTVSSVGAFEIDNRGAESKMPPPMEGSEQEWGPWRLIDRADSPDNYPNGKYEDDPSHYDEDGNYIYAWDSQEAYESWLVDQIRPLGGQIAGDRYRLPLSAEVLPGAESDPKDVLAPMPVKIQSLYYTR